MEAGNLKSDRNQEAFLFESVMGGRRRLSDITNMTHQQRLARRMADQENLNPNSHASTQDCTAQLIKENTALLRLLEERNKIIELNGLELQKLRLAFQNVQQQNWQLAQANSQMLVELNLGKDKIKSLQHELGCTTAVLKTKNLELEEKKKSDEPPCDKIGTTEKKKSDEPPCDKIGATEKKKSDEPPCDKIGTTENPAKCSEVPIDLPHQSGNKKPCNTNRKRTSSCNSLGSKTVSHQVRGKEKGDSRRKSLRSWSSSSKPQPCEEPREDLFEIADTKVSVCSPLNDPMKEDDRIQLESLTAVTSSNSVDKPVKEEHKDGSCSPPSKNQESRRTSVGRPLRRAKEGVSYKERPVNIKLRRE